ncbi:MAG TPA: hypothetical protein VIK04_21095 [Solirubrobacteraceae bacterium]
MYGRVIHARDSLLGEVSQPAGITSHKQRALHDIRYQALRNRDSGGIREPRVVKPAGERQQVVGLRADLVTADDHGS